MATLTNHVLLLRECPLGLVGLFGDALTHPPECNLIYCEVHLVVGPLEATRNQCTSECLTGPQGMRPAMQSGLNQGLAVVFLFVCLVLFLIQLTFIENLFVLGSYAQVLLRTSFDFIFFFLQFY